MDYAERIAALEQQLAKLRADLMVFNMIFQNQGGTAHAFQSAVCALIVSTPPNTLLHRVLPDHIARTEAFAVSEIQSEEYLQGVQQAQALMISALTESRLLFAEVNAQQKAAADGGSEGLAGTGVEIAGMGALPGGGNVGTE